MDYVNASMFNDNRNNETYCNMPVYTVYDSIVKDTSVLPVCPGLSPPVYDIASDSSPSDSYESTAIANDHSYYNISKADSFLKMTVNYKNIND